jgi:hypothetical protein
MDRLTKKLLSKSLCTITNLGLRFRPSMNFPSAFLFPVALVCLAPLLIVGCITTSAPPNPGGVVQVWIEQSSVRVLRDGKTLSVIKPKLPRVEQWKLVQNDTAIVIKSRSSNQDPAAVELFDISTGALKERLMTFSLYTGQPTWARGFEDH